MKKALPPGQRLIHSFPRFGLSHFANRFPRQPDHLALKIAGLVEAELVVSAELQQLPRVEQLCDFHCVTTWSCQSLRWSGYRFKDFYQQIVLPGAKPDPKATLVLMRGQDGYRSGLPLADLLADNVLLADQLDGKPLSVEHGAPLRIVAPAHYGYKNVKHMSRLEFVEAGTPYKAAALPIMDHPRARVAFEERGRNAPGWVYRLLYRPLVEPTKIRFDRAMKTFVD